MFRALLVAALAALLAVLVALYISAPLPEGLEDKREAQIGTMMINLAHKIAELTGKLGVEGLDEARVNQKIAGTFSHLFRGSDDDLVQTEHLTMAGTPVILYHYMGADNPKKQGLAPAVVFIHGGGWVVMNTDFYHQALQRLVRKTKLMLISIEYKLAPDSVFPGPMNECVGVVKHFISNAHKFGNDKHRIITMGDSAGGNLAAAVNLVLRDKKVQPQPLAQVLVYPYLQYLDLATPSYQGGSVIVTSKDTCIKYGLWYLLGVTTPDHLALVRANRHISSATLLKHAHKLLHQTLPQEYFPSNYAKQDRSNHKGISSEFDAMVTNPYFSPLMADDLSKLPQTFIQTCQYDVLRDDGYFYAQRLQKAKVKVKYVNYLDSFHGAFLRDMKFVDDIAEYLDEIL